MKNLLSIATGLIGFISAAYLVIQAPQLHRLYLRYTVGSNVVKVVKTDIMGNVQGGGTGFAIRGKSGHRYIMTNAHICQMYKGGKIATIQEQDGTMLDREIIQISDQTDLCLIEGVKNLRPLDLANFAYVGQTVAVVGHPELMPLNISFGDILGEHPTDVILGMIPETMSQSDCNHSNYRIEHVDSGMFGVLDLCIEEVNAYQTTATSMPGNSGSPVVNWRGQLIGVLFAGDQKVYWGSVVVLEDVKDFLSDF